MIEWILEKLPVVIFVVVFLGQIVRGLLRSRGERTEPPPRHDELEEQRRATEIQKEIRRKIAERRAGREQQPAEHEAREDRQSAPPVIVRRDPTAIPLPEPFGGPVKRMLEEFERRAHPTPRAEPPLVVAKSERRHAELERQERLAEELRALEETRLLAQRRVANLAAAKQVEARSERGLRTAARGRVLEDLQDPESLRRAFVLREVLGPPVGLR
jgi:hypothetical protein